MTDKLFTIETQGNSSDQGGIQPVHPAKRQYLEMCDALGIANKPNTSGKRFHSLLGPARMLAQGVSLNCD